ncbi:ABC transporter substrate-binding protein [Cellulomonas sp. S1-8]|uniref:ABC transporter substrate-binding protein n=1 Tax=Cellulomonas sp. S1-8 TaxID=2904790 RepID=UPI002243BABC|nr:ABC transporter substrate-binding protein [Cellulomonas sp. S1-8]UZN04155.1 ABC transporter substrate-binding protein [Cellulomonas sp. S1-8]
METSARARRWQLGTALAATAALALAGCAGTSDAAAPTSGAGTDAVITAWPTDVTTLDPAQASSAQDWEMSTNVYQGLVMPKWSETASGSLMWGGLDLAPALAESWELDGSSATFTLRDDVTFHPSGNPLTVDDVIFSFSRPFELNRTGDLNNGGLYGIDQFTKVDDHTLTVSFENRDGAPIPATPTLMQTFRMPTFGIVDSVQAAEHVTSSDPTASQWLAENVAGTGPYYVKSRTPGEEITIEAVPDNPVVTPGVPSVTARIINSGSVAALLKGGSINLASYGLSEKDVNDLDTAGMDVVHEKTPEFTYLQLATEAGPLADPLVRQAIGYAIPYEQIIDSVFFGRAERATSYVNSAAPGYAETFARYTFDIDEAKELMADAGDPAVTVPLHFNNSDSTLEDMAILLKDNLAQIGVTLELRPETPAAFADLITSRAIDGEGSPDALLVKWSSWVDDPKTPIGYATATGGVNNYSMWSDPRVDEIVATNQYAEFTDERAASYEEAQEIVADAAPLLPIARVGRTVVMAPGFTNASFAPEFGLRYWTLKPSE